VLISFAVSVLGCDEPTDGLSDEEEIRNFRENMGEFLYDVGDERLLVNKCASFIVSSFHPGIASIWDFCSSPQLSIGFDSNLLNRRSMAGFFGRGRVFNRLDN
jgi:hypothetical protein